MEIFLTALPYVVLFVPILLVAAIWVGVGVLLYRIFCGSTGQIKFVRYDDLGGDSEPANEEPERCSACGQILPIEPEQEAEAGA